MKRRLATAIDAFVVLSTLLVLWEGLILLFRIPSYMLPSPLQVFRVALARLPSLLSSFAVTATAAVGGLVCSVVVGLLLALIFAQYRWLRQMLLPYTVLLQTVPIVAIAPLILMWVGPGLVSVTLVAFIISLAPIVANATQGMISVDRNLLNLFVMHNASPTQILWKLRLPHAIPSLFTGLRISSGISVIGAITGELFAGSSRVGQGGLGYSIVYATAQLETDYLFALVLAASALGFIFVFLVMLAEWLLLHRWHESARTHELD